MPLSAEHRATGRRAEHCADVTEHRAIDRWRMFRAAPDWALTDMPSIVPLSAVHRATGRRSEHCAIGRWRMFRAAPN